MTAFGEMFVRVYPWIVQGLTFLSVWKTQCINNYNTCCVLYKLMPLFFLLSISELVTSVAFHWFWCVVVGINAQVEQKDLL